MYRAQKTETITKHGMVASKHYLSAQAGVEILKKGGNAIDAAIATAFTDGVVMCGRMGGIGGGGYLVFYSAKTGQSTPLFFHTKTSENACPEMYVPEPEKGCKGSDGWVSVKNDENLIGYKSIAVPGFVAGLSEALKRWGKMKLNEVLQPAIRYAREGFDVDQTITYAIATKADLLSRFPESAKIFLRNGYFAPKPPSGPMYGSSDKIVQKDLAKTMEMITKEGPEYFYKGKLARIIVKDIQKNGGILSEEDFANYKPIFFNEHTQTYREYDVHYAPYAGGTTLIQMLNILEGFDLASFKHNTALSLHVIAEAIRLAYKDKLTLMGGYFEKVPVKKLESKEYGDQLRKRINLEKAIGELGPADPLKFADDCTTHVSVVDSEGNMVALTHTNQNSFGSGVTIAGTGILMNNMMSAFDPLPGRANSIGPNKFALSNMTPTVLVRNSDPYMVIGAPGNRRIQVAVLQVILNVIEYGLGIQKAIDAPRIVREMEQEIYVDSRVGSSVCRALEKKGHKIIVVDRVKMNFASPNGILRDPKTRNFHGGVDRFTIDNFPAKAVGW